MTSWVAAGLRCMSLRMVRVVAGSLLGGWLVVLLHVLVAGALEDVAGERVVLEVDVDAHVFDVG